MEKSAYFSQRKIDYEIFDFISDKTTLRYKEIDLVYNLIIFLLKKRIHETGQVEITCLGKFYTRSYKRAGVKVRFKSFKKMKYIVNGSKPNIFKKYASLEHMKDIYLEISKLTGLSKKNVTFFLNLLFFKMYDYLKENRSFKFRLFGKFYLKKYNMKRTTFCGFDVPMKNEYRILFRPHESFKRELNNEINEIVCSHRMTRFLRLNKISRELNKQNI
jgi:nucleoid DNA-binding protein